MLIKRYYKTLKTSVLNSTMSPLSLSDLKTCSKDECGSLEFKNIYHKVLRVGIHTKFLKSLNLFFGGIICVMAIWGEMYPPSNCYGPPQD